MSDSVRPHRQQLTRLHHPWDFPGKNSGVGCHFLLQFMKVKSESEVAQSCPTLCDPMDCSLSGSSILGIFQARVLEWLAALFYRYAWASLIAQLVKNLPPMQETLVRFLGQEDPLEEGQATHSGILGLPLWLSWQKVLPQCRRPGFNPWVGRTPQRRERLPTPVFWPGEFHGLYSPRCCKELDMTEQLSL